MECSKALKAIPSPLKNLFWNSTQCSLSPCKKHSIVSIINRTAQVTAKNTTNPMIIPIVDIIIDVEFVIEEDNIMV